jgi:uncharacterized membrane protein YiaA
MGENKKPVMSNKTVQALWLLIVGIVTFVLGLLSLLIIIGLLESSALKIGLGFFLAGVAIGIGRTARYLLTQKAKKVEAEKAEEAKQDEALHECVWE